MALPSAFVAGPPLPLRRTAGVAALSVTPPRRAAVVVAPRMMADKNEGGGLPFGLKLPSFGGKKGAAKAKAAAPKAKTAVNQFAAKASSKADATVAKAATATKNAAGKVENAAEETFMRLQPGDAGYVEPTAKSTASSIKSAASDVGDAAKSAAKGAGKAVQAATPTNVKKAAGKAADAVEDAVDDVLNAAKKPAARGLGLLREDLLKSAPERAGIGRQDQVGVAAPTYGEPGYVEAGVRASREGDRARQSRVRTVPAGVDVSTPAGSAALGCAVRARWIEDGQAHHHVTRGTFAGAARGWDFLLRGDHVRRMGRSTSVSVSSLQWPGSLESFGFLTAAC